MPSWDLLPPWFWYLLFLLFASRLLHPGTPPKAASTQL